MIVAILADEEIKSEIINKGHAADVEIIWADSLQSLRIIEADAYFDLLFENDNERVNRLKFLLPKPVFVNDVIHTCKNISVDLFRINAWPTMMNRKIVEVAVAGEVHHKQVTEIFNKLSWDVRIVPDITGMITPRIVGMIINEAWFSLAEHVSTREEIDTAMKLGTNYPYGPFEWGDKIGLNKVKSLLSELQKTDPRYTIAPGLTAGFIWH
jgi:3-hydroxybutyryl-CoA dehydrogenase